MKIVCISAGNMLNSRERSTSFRMCRIVSKVSEQRRHCIAVSAGGEEMRWTIL